jgi:hypothetical protein
MTWKIQAITGELTGQEISIDRDMLVGVIKQRIFYYNNLKFRVNMRPFY